MSKAFTKEDDGGGEVIVPRRAPLPRGFPNYVTARGLSLLREELLRLDAERERLHARSVDRQAADDPSAKLLAARRGELTERIVSATLIEPGQAGPADAVRFGTAVIVRTAAGALQRYHIVGVDEGNVAEGRLAFTSPLARALLGRQVGDVAQVSSHADAEVEILDISVDDGA